MPTQQPTSAPDGIGTDAAEQDTAAAVLHDDALDQMPGGGEGPRGAAGADPLAARTAGGPSRNSPIDTGVASPDENASAVVESQVQAAEADPAEPHPGSQ